MAEKSNRIDGGRGKWETPVMGTLAGIPLHQLPPTALHSALNVWIKNGSLQVRPGMTQFTSTVLTGRPTGAFNSTILASGAFQADAFQNDAFQVAGSVPSALLVVGTTKKLYIFYNGALNDITGSPDLTALDTSLARFTGIQIGSPPSLFILHTNGVDPMRQWDAASANFTVVAGSPSLFTDITTISDHIIGIVPPYNIAWNDTLDLASWPALNSRVLADTSDPLVAISNFGITGGSIYKDQSIWNVIVTGLGTEATYFRFDYRETVEGPASPAALVNATKAHYYMTKSGRIGRWDGFQHSWVGDGIWPLIQAELDSDNSARIHGSFLPTPLGNAVVFFYPRTGDAGENKGMAIVLIPRPQEGIDHHIAFQGRLMLAVSASTDLRLDLKKMMLFTSATPRAYTFEGADDAGNNFDGHWQTGLSPVQGPNPARIESVEALLERSAGYGTLTFKPVFSNILDVPDGTLGGSASIDLTTAPKPFDLKGTDVRGRYLGARFEFTTPVTVRYKGVNIVVKDGDK